MQQLQWLSGCMKDKRKWFWLAMALAVVSAGLCVVFPFITQQITDRVLVGQTLPDGSVQRQTQLLVPLVCVMIGAQLLRSCVRYGMTASLEYVSQNVQQDIRRHLYDNLCTQDAGFYTRYRTGDLMTRLTGDLDMVRHTVCWISYNAVESTSLSRADGAATETIRLSVTGFPVRGERICPRFDGRLPDEERQRSFSPKKVMFSPRRNGFSTPTCQLSPDGWQPIPQTELLPKLTNAVVIPAFFNMPRACCNAYPLPYPPKSKIASGRSLTTASQAGSTAKQDSPGKYSGVWIAISNAPPVISR